MVLPSPVFYSLENESCCQAILPFLFSVLIFCGPLAAQTALLATATTLEKVNIFIIIRSIAVKILSLLDKADDNGQCRDSRALDKAVQLTAQKIHYC